MVHRGVGRDVNLRASQSAVARKWEGVELNYYPRPLPQNPASRLRRRASTTSGSPSETMVLSGLSISGTSPTLVRVTCCFYSNAPLARAVKPPP